MLKLQPAVLLACAFFAFPTLGAGMESNSAALEKVWALGRTEACTPGMRSAFSEENLARFPASILESHDRTALALALNPFLLSLGFSHTKFMTPPDEDFFFFKSHHALVDLRPSPNGDTGSQGRSFYTTLRYKQERAPFWGALSCLYGGRCRD